MKHFIFFTILSIPFLANTLVPIDVYAQKKPYSIEWSRCYGGSRDENGSGIPGKKMVLRTPDGGYIFAGETSSKDGDINKSRRHNDMFQQDSFKNVDIWIVKLSAGGSIEWEQYYGGEGTDYVNQILPTSDGGYVLCGETNSFSGDFPFDTSGITQIRIHGGLDDGFVMKLDSLGQKEWISRTGGSDYDYLYTVIQTADGGYLASGSTNSNEEYWGGLSWIKHQGPWGDGFIVKLGSDGSKKWNRLYGGTGNDGISSVVEKQGGGFILCGGTNSEDGDVSKLHYKDSINSIGATGDLWIVEINTTGDIIREKCFGGSSEDGGASITRAVDGGFLITGHTFSPDGDVVGYHMENKDVHTADPFDAWIFKIDTALNIVWQNCIGGSQQDGINSLIPTRSGGYAFIGSTNSSDSNLTGIHKPENNMDIWIGELSSGGKLLWQQCFGGTANDYGNGIVENDDGGFTLFASVGSMDGDISGNHGGGPVHNRDIWVAKLRPGQVGVNSASGETHFANPYPNPSGDQMNMYLQPTESLERVQFFNPLGAEVFPSYQIKGTLLTADMSTLANGMYIIRITYDGRSVVEVRKFVKAN